MAFVTENAPALMRASDGNCYFAFIVDPHDDPFADASPMRFWV
jgi:hypothetical protein